MSYEAMLAMYKKSQERSSTNSSFNSEENLKNYFSIWMPDGVNEKQFRIRILPDTSGELPFKITHMHTLKTPPYTKFLCPKHFNGDDCPFCETKDILSKGNADEKKIANNYGPKDFFVVKVIDREHEADGPKFWRFAKNYKGQGIFDKIMDIVVLLGPSISIYDPVDGFDLIISAKRDTTNPKQFNVTSIMTHPAGKSVLSENTELVSAWLADERTMKDVYKPKTYEYMALIIEGKTPVYDKEKGIFVSKEEVSEDSTETDSQNDINNLVQETNNNNFNTPEETISSSSTNFEDDDDVPF